MKRIGALLIAVCMTLSLAACGLPKITITTPTASPSETAGGVVNTDPTKAPEAPTAEPSQAPTETPDGGDGGQQLPVVGGPAFTLPVTMGTVSDWYQYVPEQDRNLGHVSIPTVYYYDNEGRFEELSLALESISNKLFDASYVAYGNMRDIIDAEFNEDEPWNWTYGLFEDVSEAALLRADSNVVSFACNHYSYYGGAHPYLEYSAYNIDSVTGKILTLEDVVTDTSKLPATIARCYADMGLTDFETEELEAIVTGILGGEGGLVFGMDYDGMNFYFGDYSLGSYAAGTAIVHVPYNRFPGLFNENYLNIPADYAVPLNNSFSTVFRSGEGSSIKELSLWRLGEEGMYDDYNYYYGYQLGMGDYETAGVDISAYNIRGSYIHFGNGHEYIYVSVQTSSGPNVIDAYVIQNEQIYHFDSYEDMEIYNSFYSEDGTATIQMTSPYDFPVSSRFYLPNSSTICKICSISEDDGSLYTWAADYTIITYGKLVCQDKVYGRILDENREYAGDIRVFEPGEIVEMAYTDTFSYVDFTDEDGKFYRLPISKDEWGEIYYDDGELMAGIYDLFEPRYDDSGYSY